MPFRKLCLQVLGLWFVLAPMVGLTQIRGRGHAYEGVDADGNAQTVEAALHLMSDRASVIFVGTVTAVQRPETSDGFAAGAVEISFTVEQAVRGCTSGGTYTLREWGGLWIANNARYRVGQRRLMLLHAAGPGGMSSPVGGMDGAIPVRGSFGTAVTETSTTEAVPDPVVDLRWVAARLGRTLVYRKASTLPASAKAEIHPTTSSTSADTGTVTIAAATADTSVPAQESSVSSVLGLLSGWQEPTDAQR